METLAETSLQLKRQLTASPENVFDAWIEVDSVEKWLAPSAEYYTHVAELDPVEGGTYRIEMRHQGGNTHVVVGTYLTVDRPNLLRFTWGWLGGQMAAMGESIVSLEFKPTANGGTELTITHEFGSAEPVGEHKKGWEGTLLRMASILDGPSRVHHLDTLLSFHKRLYLNALEGVSTEQLSTRANDRVNHMLWLAGHLAHTRGMIANTLGSDLVSPLAIFNDEISDETDYPDLDTAMAFFDKATTEIRNHLPSVTNELLTAPHAFPHDIPLNDQTIGGMLDFLVDHESYHIGQLGLLRKMMGHEAMSYRPSSPPAPHHGRFVWYDLMTTNPEAAQIFYTAVAGWGTTSWAPEGIEDAPPYTMWTNNDVPLGGVMTLPDEAVGIPPHWIGFIGANDLDETAAAVMEHGGQIVKPPTQIPTVGRFAIVKDPQGAVLALFTADSEEPGAGGEAQVGAFSWHELATTDGEAGFAFYQDVFGWPAAGEMDSPAGIYRMFGEPEQPRGGIYTKPEEMPQPAWLFYIRVDDIDAAVSRVTENGGQILNGPMEVPGGDLIAQCMDPQGAAFALHAQKALSSSGDGTM